MEKIAITGATGFVGNNLIEYLNHRRVQTQKVDRKQLQHIHQSTIAACTGIVHLAGKAHDLKKTANADEYYQVNYELTKTLYDAFLKSEAKKFIFISSVKAAADSVEGILSEEREAEPQTHYGKSKLMAEQYIQSQPLPAGKAYYILRPCMIHGPGNKGNLNLLYQFVKKGIPYPFAAYENRRSFLSIENLCFVIKAFLEKEVPSGVYNVADDESLSTNEVVAILAKSLNRKPKLWAIQSTIIKMLANVGDFLKLPINSERLNKLTEDYVVSNRKIKLALKTELPVATKDGLAITAQSFN